MCYNNDITQYGGLLVENLTQWCSAALNHMITVKLATPNN